MKTHKIHRIHLHCRVSDMLNAETQQEPRMLFYLKTLHLIRAERAVRFIVDDRIRFTEDGKSKHI